MNGSNNDPTGPGSNNKKGSRPLRKQNVPPVNPDTINNKALEGENQSTPETPSGASVVQLEPVFSSGAKVVELEPVFSAQTQSVPDNPPSSPPSFFQRIGDTFKKAGASVAAAATSATSAVSSLSVSSTSSMDLDDGPEIWGAMNAVSFIVLTALLGFALCYGATHIGNAQHVKKHWKHYRCQPAYMPFAGFYGYNVADNFEFCMKNIFEANSGDVTSSFGSVLGMFTTIIGVIMEAVNALRTSIATMGGGINVIFQDFTDRIKMFFFQIQVSAMRIKMLIGRMYAIMFAVLYMGMSSITAGTNFSNTVLFSFLDTFCFPPETPLRVKGRGTVPISEVRVGDVLLPGGTRVTAKFHFAAAGQPMVRLGDVVVSTNHYVKHDGHWKKAADHPDAVPLGPYDRQSLVCLNTDTHTIPIGDYVFRDYDETNTADTETMRFVESRVNGSVAAQTQPYPFTDSNTGLQRSARIKLKGGLVKAARNIQLGDELSTGAKVVGIVHRQQTEFCCVPTAAGKAEFVSPGTLVWNAAAASAAAADAAAANKWVRAGELYTPFRLKSHPNSPLVFLSFIVTPNSQLELESGLTVRDYMELCSPDTEAFYARDMAALTEENA